MGIREHGLCLHPLNSSSIHHDATYVDEKYAPTYPEEDSSTFTKLALSPYSQAPSGKLNSPFKT